VTEDDGESNPTIYDRAKAWLESPRNAVFRQNSKSRNYSASLNAFAPILKDFTADDLMVDQLYWEFLKRFKELLPNLDKASNTLKSYIGILTGKILQHADVKPSVVVEFKSHIRQILKEMNLPKPVNKSVADEDVVNWLHSLDRFCEQPESAPNLNAIANPNSKVKNPKNTSIRLLLALRCYAWLCLITSGRADEVRRIRISEINENWVKRELLKAKLYTETTVSAMPSWAWERIQPYLEYVKENKPSATLLFSKTDDLMGKGTIAPGTLRELVKGSMMNVGLEPTSPGGKQYRVHDLRKTIARWINENEGSIAEISACLGHSSPEVTYKHYFADEVKEGLAASGQAKAMERLGELLQERESLDKEIEELRALFSHLDHIEFFDDGGVALPEGTAFGGPGCIIESHDGMSVVRAPGLEPGTS